MMLDNKLKTLEKVDSNNVFKRKSLELVNKEDDAEDTAKTQPAYHHVWNQIQNIDIPNNAPESANYYMKIND